MATAQTKQRRNGHKIVAEARRRNEIWNQI
jgi:hypothetical protein